MAQAQPKALTERDKYDELRRKDAEQNLKATKDVDPTQLTAVHAARLPSDVSSFALTHGLSEAEAERVMDRTDNGKASNTEGEVAAEIAGRTVYRPVWVETPAGVSDPFNTVSSASVPVPPDPDLLDPNAPNPGEPTGHVAGRARDTSTELTDTFANQVADAVDATDETAEQLGDTDAPEVPVK